MIKTHSIAEFVKKNQERSSIHWRIADGKQLFCHHISGIWFEGKDFNRMYPKYEYEPFNPKGENINKKIFQGI